VSDPRQDSGYLLDTHAAIFSLRQSSALPIAAKAAIATGPNYLSVISYWEVVLKSMKNTLDVGDPRAWWTDALEQLVATPLLLRPQHIAGVCGLPPIHKDPFARLLIAQAALEGLVLVTMDGEIAQYASENLRVVE
jgi:PIN domain nuclease of toxin-antitoxin system